MLIEHNLCPGALTVRRVGQRDLVRVRVKIKNIKLKTRTYVLKHSDGE